MARVAGCMGDLEWARAQVASARSGGIVIIPRLLPAFEAALGKN